MASSNTLSEISNAPPQRGKLAVIFALLLVSLFAYFAFALPSVTYVSPTLSDNATTGSNWVYVNVTSSEDLNQSLLEWGNSSGFTNVSMTNVSSMTNWYKNMTGLADGTYNYTVWAQNTTGGWNASETRSVQVVPSATTVSINVTWDANVRADTPDTNYGATLTTVVGTLNGNESRAYLKFNLSSIPDWRYLASCKLYWKTVSVSGYGAENAYIYELSNVSEEWDEENITWNNKPVNSVSPVSQSLNISSIAWHEFDVTSAARKAYYTYGLDNLTLVVIDNVLKGDNNYSASRTKDYAANQPYLNCTYTDGTIPPGNNHLNDFDAKNRLENEQCYVCNNWFSNTDGWWHYASFNHSEIKGLEYSLLVDFPTFNPNNATLLVYVFTANGSYKMRADTTLGSTSYNLERPFNFNKSGMFRLNGTYPVFESYFNGTTDDGMQINGTLYFNLTNEHWYMTNVFYYVSFAKIHGNLTINDTTYNIDQGFSSFEHSWNQLNIYYGSLTGTGEYYAVYPLNGYTQGATVYYKTDDSGALKYKDGAMNVNGYEWFNGSYAALEKQVNGTWQIVTRWNYTSTESSTGASVNYTATLVGQYGVMPSPNGAFNSAKGVHNISGYYRYPNGTAIPISGLGIGYTQVREGTDNPTWKWVNCTYGCQYATNFLSTGSGSVNFSVNWTAFNASYNITGVWFNITYPNGTVLANLTANIYSGNNQSGIWYYPLSNAPAGAYNVRSYSNDSRSVWVVASSDFTLNATAACQELNYPGTYILTVNVSSEATCFTIKANNVTLDGQGYTINYSQSVGGYAINNSLGYDNITIKNLNIIQGGTSSSSYAIYLAGTLGSNITNNTIRVSGTWSAGILLNLSNSNIISGNDVTTTANNADTIYLISSNSNTFLNNNFTSTGGSILNPSSTVYIRSSGWNNITGGSIVAKDGSYSYAFKLENASATNSFVNTNFTVSRKIRIFDADSWFNYNNETSGNIWLKTKVSGSTTLTRTLVSWGNASMKWNDSASVTARYNVTGLLPNASYNIYGTSAGTQSHPYNLKTDSSGNLPEFNISLSGNIEILVQSGPKITIQSPGTAATSNNTLFDLNITLDGNISGATVSIANASATSSGTPLNTGNLAMANDSWDHYYYTYNITTGDGLYLATFWINASGYLNPAYSYIFTAKNWYDYNMKWTEDNKTKWAPNKPFSMNWSGHQLGSSEQMFDDSDMLSKSKFLNMTSELGVAIARFSIHPDVWNQYKSNYSQLFNETRALGLKLWVTYQVSSDSGIQNWTHYNETQSNFTKDIITNYSPDYYSIIDERDTMEDRMGLDFNESIWEHIVESQANLTKSINSSVITIATVMGTELDWVDNLVENVSNIDAIGFNIYGVYYMDTGEIQSKMSYARSNGKYVAIEETWTSWNNPNSIEGITHNEPWRAEVDANWVEALAYFAYNQSVDIYDPFFTGKFVNYTGNATEYQEAVLRGDRTEVFYRYSKIIADAKPDTTPPVIMITNPTNATPLSAGTASTWVNITTDENAICRYNLTNSSFAYTAGTNFMNTGGLSHSFLYSGLANSNTYGLYYLCNDTYGNVNMQSTYHTFSVSAAQVETPPECTSCGGGGGGGGTTPQNKTNQTTKNITVTAPKNISNATTITELDIKQKAEQKIREIKQKIKNEDIKAKEKIEAAEQAYATGEYERAYDLAVQAEGLLRNIELKSEEGKAWSGPYYAVAIISLAGAGLYLYKLWQKRKFYKGLYREMDEAGKPKERAFVKEYGKSGVPEVRTKYEPKRVQIQRQVLKPKASKGDDLDDIQKRLEEIRRKIGK